MPAVSITEAARALGFKSRSTLYRLIGDGYLADYLRPDGPTGRQSLELTPAGLPALRDRVAQLIRPQLTNGFGERQRAPRIDPRWEEVAGALTEALAAHGALQLCGHEAKALTEALPNALAAFGWEQLDALRAKLADLGVFTAGPRTPNIEKEQEWWSEWGRWDPGTDLNDKDFWESVARIVGGMMGGEIDAEICRSLETPHGNLVAHMYSQTIEAIESVQAGARWDDTSWDNASAVSLLEFPEVEAGECLSSLPELETLAGRGNLTPALQAQADAALASYRKNDQREAAALSAVLS